jgi:phosphate transport system ATP-binding protein
MSTPSSTRPSSPSPPSSTSMTSASGTDRPSALHDISMPVTRGHVTALIGPSGCGKSTLLRSVNRLNDLIDGVRTDRRHAAQRLVGLRPAMSMSSTSASASAWSSRSPTPSPCRSSRMSSTPCASTACARKVLARCLRAGPPGRRPLGRGQGPAQSVRPGLSGGQQQRLCIARAIVADPEVLLLDEPCSALDPIATGKVEELIAEISERYTVLIVTHNMQQAARVSKYTAFMYLGRLVEYGPTESDLPAPRTPRNRAVCDRPLRVSPSRPGRPPVPRRTPRRAKPAPDDPTGPTPAPDYSDLPRPTGEAADREG